MDFHISPDICMTYRFIAPFYLSFNPGMSNVPTMSKTKE